MQSLVSSNEGKDDRIASNGASILCHAPTEPLLKSKKAESRGDKKTALENKKPSSIPLKQVIDTNYVIFFICVWKWSFSKVNVGDHVEHLKIASEGKWIWNLEFCSQIAKLILENQ